MQVIADEVGPVTSLAYHRGALFLASVQRGFLRIANHPDAQPVDINVPLGPMPIVNVSGRKFSSIRPRVSVDDWTAGQLEQLIDLKPDGPVWALPKFSYRSRLRMAQHFQLKLVLTLFPCCDGCTKDDQLSVQEAAAGGPGWLMTGFGRTRLFGEDEAAGGFVAAWTQAVWVMTSGC